MALPRPVRDLVRRMDGPQLRQLIILAAGRLQAQGDNPFLPAGPDGGAVSYRSRMVRCGKATCERCPHGPYWYASWRDGGRTRTTYIGKDRPSDDSANWPDS